MAEPIVKLVGVKKSYAMGREQLEVLHGINLEVRKGDSLAIMGPSGSGKSTVLHIMGLLDVPTGGKVFMDGKDTSLMGGDELAHLRAKKVGFVFQFFYLIPSLTAIENVMLPLMFASVSEEERRSRADGLLRKVGLSGRMDHRPNELSGGERQRVAIARALVQKPALLLADEPTGNLDSKVGNEIIRLFHKLQDEEGVTLVMVTHDHEIAKLSKKIIRVRDGIVIKGDDEQDSGVIG